jgi:hypothetical protein
VHNIVPFITVDGVRYSMPAATLGQLVEIRRQVDAGEFSVVWAGRTVATHALGVPDDTVWDPEHHADAQAIALGRHRDRDDRHLQLVASTTTKAAAVGRLDLAGGDYDVDTPDLNARYGGELA